MPVEKLEAFRDHGQVNLSLEDELDEARAQLDQLAGLGIDLEAIGRELLEKGIQKFIEPYDSVLDTIQERSAELVSH
jgi:transaldolase